MKLKLLILLSTSLLLTGCSITNQSPAKAQVVLGCDSFNLEFESNDFTTPLQARKHFAEAARLDPGYLPLAQAAELLTDSFSTAAFSDLAQEWRMANRLVRGVCAD
jgi:hypothetical protein